MKKAAIFDMDGLLIDSEIVSYEMFRDFMKEYGYDFSLAEYTKNYCGMKAEDNVKRLLHDYALPYTFADALKEIVGREDAYMARGVKLKDGAKDLLDVLKEKNRKIILATSSLKPRAESLLGADHVLEYFDDMAVGSDVEHGKPEPDLFLKAWEKSGVKKEECLVLEDSEAGIEAAYRAGIDVICIPDLKQPREKYQKMAWHILPNLRDVAGYLG